MSTRAAPAARPRTDRARSRASRTIARVAGAAACVCVAAIAAALPARAGVEEFSTFSVEEQERDDESLLDHILARVPPAWRDEWESSPLALRSAQGCITSGKWYNQTDLKLSAPAGGRTRFAVAVRQNESDRVDYNYMDFSIHVATRFGTAGWMFRPARDKSSQDMALMWDVGADTSAFQLQAVFGLEDVFNNFWEFRQASTGGVGEPYVRHPWEPGLRVVVRQPSLRVEMGGRYLTPSTKRIIVNYGNRDLDNVQTLWGTLAWASVEARALGIEWEVRSTNHQARSTAHALAAPLPDGRDFRRQWSVESAARGRIAPRLTAEARWLYQERTQVHGPPVDPLRFDGVDRVLQLETVWAVTPALLARVGGLRDRITIRQSAITAPFSFGSRVETRAYVAGVARFGRMSLQIVEAIELNHEPYNVWAVHDKGFVQVQATF